MCSYASSITAASDIYKEQESQPDTQPQERKAWEQHHGVIQTAQHVQSCLDHQNIIQSQAACRWCKAAQPCATKKSAQARILQTTMVAAKSAHELHQNFAVADEVSFRRQRGRKKAP
jgi:hypothetical protein